MVDATGSGYVIFRLGDEQYGLPVGSVNSIIRFESATPVPRSPESVMGVINLRGRVVPVVDLLKRFRGRTFEPGPASRIVVADGAMGPVGIAVDAANEVTNIEESSKSPVPDGVLSADTARAFQAVVERDGSLIILLELDEAIPHGEYAPAYGNGDEEVGEQDV